MRTMSCAKLMSTAMPEETSNIPEGFDDAKATFLMWELSAYYSLGGWIEKEMPEIKKFYPKILQEMTLWRQQLLKNLDTMEEGVYKANLDLRQKGVSFS